MEGSLILFVLLWMQPLILLTFSYMQNDSAK